MEEPRMKEKASKLDKREEGCTEAAEVETKLTRDPSEDRDASGVSLSAWVEAIGCRKNIRERDG
eukprot:8037593-Karenia_brevis.AAC.1